MRRLESVVTQFPQYAAYRFLYLGDTARCPYGDRDAQTITRFVSEITAWLQSRGANCVVMACNTSAALASAAAKANCAVPVYDLIGATAQYVAARGYRTGVLATKGTVRSKAFSRAISDCRSDAYVVEIACPDLVPLIESGFIDSPQTMEALHKYAQQLKAEQVEAVIFGCTHYPFLRQALERLLPGVELVDPAEHLAQVLIQQPIPIGAQPSINKEFFVTGSAETFAQTARRCLGSPLQEVNTVAVAELEAMPALSAVPSAVPATAAEALGSSGLVS